MEADMIPKYNRNESFPRTITAISVNVDNFKIQRKLFDLEYHQRWERDY